MGDFETSTSFGGLLKDDTKPTASQIEQERIKRLKAENKYRGENKWVDFFKSVGYRFVWTLLFAIMACNFIYMSSNEYLDVIFPSKEEYYFPNFNPLKKKASKPRASASSSSGAEDVGAEDVGAKDDGAKDDGAGAEAAAEQVVEAGAAPEPPKGGGSDISGGSYANCAPFLTTEPKPELIGLNFPYNLVAPEDGDWDLMQSFKNWFASTTAHTFITGRKILKEFFRFFRPPGLFSYQPIQIFVATPFAIIMTVGALIFGCITSFFFAIQDGPLWAIGGMICFYTFAICLCEGLMYALKYLSTLLFYGASNDWEGCKNILSCNVKYFVIFYGWLICGSAFEYLDPTISIMMSIGFLGMCVKLLWADVKGFVNL